MCRQLGCGQKGREGLREEGEPSRRPGRWRRMDWACLALAGVPELRAGLGAAEPAEAASPFALLHLHCGESHARQS